MPDTTTTRRFLAPLEAENARLRAEVERLTRLCDALARFPVYRGFNSRRWFVETPDSQWGPYPSREAAVRGVIEHAEGEARRGAGG